MNPVCLVIGAGAGIGGTVGKRFAREGPPRVATTSVNTSLSAPPEPGRPGHRVSQTGEPSAV